MRGRRVGLVQGIVQKGDVRIVWKNLARAIEMERLVTFPRLHPCRRRAIPLQDHAVASDRPDRTRRLHLIEQHARHLPMDRARPRSLPRPSSRLIRNRCGPGNPGGSIGSMAAGAAIAMSVCKQRRVAACS
jgi:hypothetical protein